MLDSLPMDLSMCILELLSAKDRACLRFICKAWAFSDQNWCFIDLTNVNTMALTEAVNWIDKACQKSSEPGAFQALKIPSILDHSGLEIGAFSLQRFTGLTSLEVLPSHACLYGQCCVFSPSDLHQLACLKNLRKMTLSYQTCGQEQQYHKAVDFGQDHRHPIYVNGLGTKQIAKPICLAGLATFCKLEDMEIDLINPRENSEYVYLSQELEGLIKLTRLHLKCVSSLTIIVPNAALWSVVSHLKDICLENLNDEGTQLVRAPNVTRLKLLGRNVWLAHQGDEAKWDQYEAPCGWQAPNLKALSLNIYKLDTSFFPNGICSGLTYLKLQSTGLWTRQRIDDVRGHLPRLDNFCLLRKLRVNDFAIRDGVCLLDSFVHLKRLLSLHIELPDRADNPEEARLGEITLPRLKSLKIDSGYSVSPKMSGIGASVNCLAGLTKLKLGQHLNYAPFQLRSSSLKVLRAPYNIAKNFGGIFFTRPDDLPMLQAINLNVRASWPVSEETDYSFEAQYGRILQAKMAVDEFMSRLSQLSGITQLKLHFSASFCKPLGILTPCLDRVECLRGLEELELDFPDEILDLNRSSMSAAKIIKITCKDLAAVTGSPDCLRDRKRWIQRGDYTQCFHMVALN